ncbi:protein Wnt-3a [Anopheles aquasalis]|uniref:protein Wnt-3a n=1 Tax=Anopheles aquasalis TaxID=42839 RepID=UPI00215A2158|nr:protein Wnt-3a [Anopheles aquasalis]XP_050084871.1 protein Wnt-3a [Anopheles aquasalis]XP_050084872.1 protein Wnt-3a [Anopheles aquasalis]XP_050084873.1 protein Wnt-3a [Anopheles aquasalis]
MRLVLVVIYLILIMPITGLWRAEGSNVLLEPERVCESKHRKSRRLSGRLADICKNDTSLMREIHRGISLGFRECESQFRHSMWNCSWTIKRSMRRILAKDTRETAFVHAITAAGITYAVTKACTMGDLLECSCQKHSRAKEDGRSHGGTGGRGRGGQAARRGQQAGGPAPTSRTNVAGILIAPYQPNPSYTMGSNPDRGTGHQRQQPRRGSNNGRRRNQRHLKPSGPPRTAVGPTGATGGSRPELPATLTILTSGQEEKWKWGGCDDNVNFGVRKSKDFLDARLRKKSDIKTLVRQHNSNAGRLAVKQFMRLECKCHGLSGSCTTKTCWMKLPPFAEVGARLKEHFDGATKVIARNDGHSFMPDEVAIKPPTKRDLVYTEDSDDFCEPNGQSGSLGTHGRVCNISSSGIDGCSLMCCKRGQTHSQVEVRRNCNCSFKWCCEVTCSTCIDIQDVYTCK